jgi:DNA-directed RNA polymerase subunit RPC12/RpoP
MIKFTCPLCNKALRADSSKAGSPVKCPECGHKLTIPDAEIEEVPEDREPVRPSPRKKKRRRSRTMSPEANRGRVHVIIICCVVLGMHLVSLIRYLATPDPVEVAKKVSRETYEKLGKALPKDFEEKWEKEFDKVAGGKEMQDTLRRSQWSARIWLAAGFGLSAVLLTCLYLRQDWARVVLGVLFLLGVALGVLGLVLGGLAALRYLSDGVAVLAVLEMLVRLGVSLAIGLALLNSESIAAYTARR